MPSVAIFVDAGYLFAQGSVAIFGSGKPRQLLKLNESAAIVELTNIASERAPNLPLLRVYWYDGVRSARQLPADHAALAFMDHVKLRLGFITSKGQQKGVDSLIVTDMIELARNHAMSDAVLLSGDRMSALACRSPKVLGCGFTCLA
ncbi:MAG TPA: NYN domain-containing protein [Acetobacteraceae bacterium]|nr:NYN domain-containing protein [Acetobacteraceae bacterium]